MTKDKSSFELRCIINCGTGTVTLCQVVMAIEHWNANRDRGMPPLRGTVQYTHVGLVSVKKRITMPQVGKLAVFAGQASTDTKQVERALKSLSSYLKGKYRLWEKPTWKVVGA